MIVERIVSPSLVILRHRDATSKEDARIPAVINKTRKIDKNFIARMLREPPPPWTEEDDLEDEVDIFFPKPEEMNIPSSQLTTYAPPLMNSSAPPPDTDLTEDDTPIGSGGMPSLKEPEKMEVTVEKERAISPDLLLSPLPTPPGCETETRR